MSQIGESLGNQATGKNKESGYRGDNAYVGRGYLAPMNKAQSRNRGSQGNY